MFLRFCFFCSVWFASACLTAGSSDCWAQSNVMPVITNPLWEDIALFEKPTKLASSPWTIFVAAAKDEAAEAARLRSVLSQGFGFAENLENLVTEITEAEHAEVLCEAVEKMAQQKAGSPRVPLADFRAIVRQYHRVINHKLPAYQVLRQRGMASLVKLYDRQLQRSDSLESDLALMRALLVFAKFGSREGERRILNALYGELGCELKYWELESADWSIYALRQLPAEILRTMFTPPVASEEFFNELRANPPSRMLAFQLLEVANGDVYWSGDPRIHPFNSPWGAEFLSYWLNGLCSATPDPKVVAELREFERSFNCGDLMRPLVGALRYVSPEVREQLLPIAMRHPDPEIQIDAAAIAAQFGKEAGWKLLQHYALDLQYGEEAFYWFRLLRREDLLPPAARNSEFRLKASCVMYSDMRSSLNSYRYEDRFPDQIKVLDQRKLDWPLEAGPKMVAIVGFVVWDKYGLGAEWTGLAVAYEGLSSLEEWAWVWDDSDSSMGRPFEDAYAIACCDSLSRYPDYIPRLTNQLPPGIDCQYIDSPTVRAELLKQWRGQASDPSESLASFQVDPAFELPVRQYVAVEGKMDGVEGWAVLAGDEVAWYPKDEQPEYTNKLTILKLHVGRLLLGFEDQPDRKAWLERKYFQRRPEEIVAIYERLMAELPNAEEERGEELMDSEGPLALHFDSYIEALLKTRGGSRAAHVVATFEQMLSLPLNGDEPPFWGPGEIATYFNEFVQSLIASGREDHAIAAIKLCLKHGPSYFSEHEVVDFGLAAYQAGRLEVAELWFGYAAMEYSNGWYRRQEVSRYAEILQLRGDDARAKGVLVDSMKALFWDIRDAEKESKEEQAELLNRYKDLWATYLKLFPAGAAELEAKGLTENPIQGEKK